MDGDNMEEQNTQTPEVKPTQGGGVGAGIGAGIIIVLIVLGGIYYLNNIREAAAPANTETTSESGDIDNIEQDLENTDIDNLDEDFAEIEAEIEAELSEE
jgi:predicted metalloprotease